MDRNEAITRIRTALRRRSGKAWSVKGGRGTAWGWIHIDVPPALRDDSTALTGRRNQLRTLLGFEPTRYPSRESVPASHAYYTEYIDRAEGRTPTIYGAPYWD